MELKVIELTRLSRRQNVGAGRIDEDANLGHTGWDGRGHRAGGDRIEEATAAGIEVQPNSVGAGSGDMCEIFRAADATDFDAEHDTLQSETRGHDTLCVKAGTLDCDGSPGFWQSRDDSLMLRRQASRCKKRDTRQIAGQSFPVAPLRQLESTAESGSLNKT